MDGAFYLPNFLIAEAFVRARAAPGRPGLQVGTALAMAGLAAFFALATFQFARTYWIPGIYERLG